MDVSIIIVSWNVKDLLKKCLDSIYQSQADLTLEIFVVDNASRDGSVEMIQKNFPKVKIIANQNNLGFAKANNQAIKKASGKYILLLNPDTEILDNGLKRAVDFMDVNPDCGALGSKMVFADGSLQPSVRRFPTPWPILLMLIKAPKIFKHLKSIDRYLAKDFDYQKQQIVDQIMGAFMLIPKKVFDQVGNLDERFFIWFEEVDLCQRIKQAGFKVIYNPKIKIIHHGGKSFAQEKAIKKQLIFFKSAWLYFKKHGLK